MAIGTLADETSTSIGKYEIKHKKETVNNMVFLSMFWMVVGFVFSIILGSDFYFSFKSLPIFIPRLILEITLCAIMTKGIAIAQRSTFAFLNTITIPFLLAVDLAIGYTISPPQIAGILLLFTALFIMFFHHPEDSKGTWYILSGSLIAVITTSIYKYDISNFNSVAAEQLIVGVTLLVFFGLKSFYKDHLNPIKLLIKPVSGTQSILRGFASVVESYAYKYVAAASIAIALKRSFSLFWAITYGHKYFQEKDYLRKLLGFVVIGVSLLLIAF